MRARILLSCLFVVSVVAAGSLSAAELPEGYWSEAEAEAILSKALTVRLDPGLSDLSEGERKAVDHLIAAGKVFQRLYELQRHHQSPEARRALLALHQAGGESSHTARLLDLYRLAKGPITTTLENERVPFLPVAPELPGKNVYPLDITREEMDAFMEAHPARREALLHPRSIVRRAKLPNIEADLTTLAEHPALDTLHPGLRGRLEYLSRRAAPETLYAIPYSVAWPDEIMEIYGHLNRAADAVGDDDADCARFLRLRARDLLADSYDGGDPAWITGRFGDLNAQIGSYETYDDALYGVKTFFSLALLKRDRAQSEALREAVKGLQEIEEMLPYDSRKRVREDLPIGVYDVVADFGQSRGSNTATILPNESHLARQYGRTIMIRANILRDQGRFDASAVTYRTAVPPDQRDHLTPEGDLRRILWHEIGHYLGVDRTEDGRELDTALQDAADLLEEMKADMVSLFSVEPLEKKGYHDEETARSVYAGGIRRVLQKVRPRRDQPYQTMQLMQWNWFLDRGVLTFATAEGTLRIDYDKYRGAVASLLEKVLDLQRRGDREAAEAFVERWTDWREDLHQVVADRLKEAETTRWTLVRYAALGE